MTTPDIGSASSSPWHPYQNRAIEFALNTPGTAWFMPPGMGKTRSWLEVIGSTEGRTLVIAPKLVAMDTWPSENRKWGYKFPMRFLHGPQRHLRGHELVSVINYEGLPWLVEQIQTRSTTGAGRDGFPYEMVIFDEVSKMKTTSSKRFNDFLKICARFKYHSGGTGTPVGAHLKDLFGEMRVCDGGAALGTDYDRFVRRYFHEDPYTRQIVPYHDAESEILRKIAPHVMSFDINDLDMPDLTHVPTIIELPIDARAYYEAMHADSVVEELNVYAANAAVRSGKLRQMASGGVLDMSGARRILHTAKAGRLAQILDEHDGRPVLVFFEYLSDYISICQVLGYDVPALYGATKASDARLWLKQWNAGKLPVLTCHPKSAAYGINMQNSGNVVVFYTIPWSLEMIIQGTGRIWRQGQKQHVMAYYLLVADTVDEDVFARVQERRGTHERVMERLL